MRKLISIWLNTKFVGALVFVLLIGFATCGRSGGRAPRSGSFGGSGSTRGGGYTTTTYWPFWWFGGSSTGSTGNGGTAEPETSESSEEGTYR